MRSSPDAFLQAAKKRDEMSKRYDDLDDLAEIAIKLKDFLVITKRRVMDDLTAVKSSGVPSTDALLSTLGFRADVRYVRYKSDENSLTQVLLNLKDTSVFRKFLEEVNNYGDNITMFFTLKGKVHMVITNKPVIPVAGSYMHKVFSGSNQFNDVYLMKIEDLPKFMDADSIYIC